MSEREQYDAAKELKIKSIKDLLNERGLSKEQIYHINNRIIKEYEPYTFDSALYYIEKNLVISEELGNQSLISETRLNLSGLLALSGRYEEAIDVLGKVQKDRLSDDLVEVYYQKYRIVFSELAFYSLVKENTAKYSSLYQAYTDSLLQFLEPSTDGYLSIIEKQYRDSRQLDDCEKINSKRLALTQMATRTYSIVTFERSLLFELENNIEQEKKFLILSAISDIKTATKDNASLTKLAVLLYEENQIDKAYSFINFSFDDALFYNSRLRFVEISNILPLITDAYRVKSEQQKADLRFSLIVISLLSIVLLLAVLFIYRQMKNLSRARNDLQSANLQLKNLNLDLNTANSNLNELNSELSESNHVKEQYIGNFLSICSNYIDKLDIYRKMVNKHIATRQVAELFEMTKSRQLIEDEQKEFYENFDNTFLNIYPTFVEELNLLLVDNEQIILKKGELLNTELRIFALIRLGVTDSSRIAKLLRYSVNTIYNYRVKIKNKAKVSRDNFEEFVMKIGAFSE